MGDEWEEKEVAFGKAFNTLNFKEMDGCDKNEDLNGGWDENVTETNNDSGWQDTNDSGSGWNAGKNRGYDQNRRGGNGGGRGRGFGRNFDGDNRRRNDQGQGYGNNDWNGGDDNDDKGRDRFNGGNRGRNGGGGGFGGRARDNRRKDDDNQGYGNNDWNGGDNNDDKGRDRFNGGNRGRNGGGGGFGDRDNRRRNDNQERYSNKNGGNNGWNNDGDDDGNGDNDSGRDRRYGGGNRGRGGGSGFDRRDNRSRNDDDNQGRYGNNSDRNWNKNDGNNGWNDERNDGNGDDDNGGGGRGGGRRGGGGNRGRGGGGAGEYSRGGRREGGGGGGGGGRGGRDGEGGYSRNKDDDNNNEEKPKKDFYIPPEPTNDEDEIFGSGISCGINFDKYDKIPVNVSGEKIPPAISSFEDSGLRDFVLKNVEKSGYMRPTPVQKNAIPIIMEGRDLMGCAQTGSGKTAAFLLPIIDNLLKDNRTMSVGKPFALIVAPTRELAIQIFSEARKFSLGSYLKISLVYGGPAVKYQSDNVTKGCHILVATVGRLMHFVNSGIISFEDIRFVVLDEADRMLDKEEDIEKIMEHPTMPSLTERQTLMFSATFPDEIQRLAAKFLNNYLFLAIGKIGGACSDVEQHFCEVTKFQKRTKLIELLEEDPSRTIVFVETKRTADFLASLLSETKFPTTSIHGDRFQREREMALNDFKSGKMSVLIATSVAARGLDIKNVKHVINYDLPQTIDIYVHRIGRTGRVGNYGKATSLFDAETDHQLASGLVTILEEIGQEVPDFLRHVKSGGRGGDGGGGRYRDKFGGRDVRKDDESFTIGTEPQSLEPEEEW